MVEKRAFSAPGKALLVGGYLVLEPEYRSYVVALSARMHAVVSTSAPERKGSPVIQLTSSQFNNDCWNFEVEQNDGYLAKEKYNKKNPFIEKVLFNVLNYFNPPISTLQDIHIDIFSDSGYHSQSSSTLKKNNFKEFAFHTKSITDVPKTGLGSSAGLVTVLTTALASVFKPDLNVCSTSELEFVHKLAQVAHCQAQGKVGSGFDVASATFGSIIYQRFEPKLITNLPDHSETGIQVYRESLQSLVDEINWNITIDRVKLPEKLRLMMGDVNNGSETTKLVAKVKEWYEKEYPRSLHVYQGINSQNLALMKSLNDLNAISEADMHSYLQMINAITSGDKRQIESHTDLKDLRDAVKEIRRNFRLITKESQADIEPAVQTALLDACMDLKGVLTGIIPGAGGYDAIALICTDDANLKSQTDGKKEFEAITWLDLHQADIGIVEENPSHYCDFECA